MRYSKACALCEPTHKMSFPNLHFYTCKEKILMNIKIRKTQKYENMKHTININVLLRFY